MTIEIKDLQQTERLLTNGLIKSINTGQTDSSKKVDPTIRNSFLRGIIQSFALGIYENNKNIQKAIKDAFLGGDGWAGFTGPLLQITQKNASDATGNIVFSGTNGTLIPQGTLITNASGIQYETQADTTISNQSVVIASIVRIGGEVIVTTVDNHNLANNIFISINGANESEYNVVNQEISVTGLKTFTFDISTAPTTPATGTLTLDFTSAVAEVTSQTLGANTNVGGIVELTIVNPIPLIDSSVFTTFEGIIGGLGVESNDSYNNRIQEKFQSYFAAPYTEVGIPIFLKEAVDGITRVWVKDSFPSAGRETIYFVRDFDVGILPTASQISDAKNAIINGTDTLQPIKPSNTPDDYVIVLAPDPVIANFQFQGVTPDTDDMKQAIENNLIDFFRNNTDFETSIPRADLFNVILQTTDSQGVNPVVSIGLTDVIVGTGQMPILGTISF